MPVLEQQKGHVKDYALADQGKSRIEWAASFMPVLKQIQERFAKTRPLAGVRIGACLHVTTETANLMLALQGRRCRDRAVRLQPALHAGRRRGRARASHYDIPTYAIKGEDGVDLLLATSRRSIASKPHMSMDDGCDSSRRSTPSINALLADMIGGCEETTTGVIRLHAPWRRTACLPYPVIAVNDALTKHMFDNRYGTGQSTLDGIIRATNVLIAGRTVVVVGLRLVRTRRRLARQGPGRQRRRHRDRSAQGARSDDGRLRK